MLQFFNLITLLWISSSLLLPRAASSVTGIHELGSGPPMYALGQLGLGGAGSVFKGTLPSGRTVAVKRLCILNQTHLVGPWELWGVIFIMKNYTTFHHSFKVLQIAVEKNHNFYW